MDSVNIPTINQNNGPLHTSEPHYIPGYTGYLPQEKFRSGHTYGFTSHQILSDPSVSMSHRSVLNNEHSSDEFSRPGFESTPDLYACRVGRDKSGVNGHGRQCRPNMPSAYKAFVPHYQTINGHADPPTYNRDLARVEQEQWWDPLVTNSLEALDGWRFRYKHKPWKTNGKILAENQDLPKFKTATPTPPITALGHSDGKSLADSMQTP